MTWLLEATATWRACN